MGVGVGGWRGRDWGLMRTGGFGWCDVDWWVRLLGLGAE